MLPTPDYIVRHILLDFAVPFCAVWFVLPPIARRRPQWWHDDIITTWLAAFWIVLAVAGHAATNWLINLPGE